MRYAAIATMMMKIMIHKLNPFFFISLITVTLALESMDAETKALESWENLIVVTMPRCAFLTTACTCILAEFTITMSPWIVPTERSFPSAETLKAEIESRTICFDPTFFHVVVFHVTMHAPRSRTAAIYRTWFLSLVWENLQNAKTSSWMCWANPISSETCNTMSNLNSSTS